MNKNLFINLLIFSACFFSCSKIPVRHSGNAEWIKVISDSVIQFPGKVRADAQNNLYCSYSYKGYLIDSSSAIIKLDTAGNILWRREFHDLVIYDFAVGPNGNPVIASYSNLQHRITLTELSSHGDDSLLKLFTIPGITMENIKDIVGMKIFPDGEDNYNISGSFFYKDNNLREVRGFMVEADGSGNELWGNQYSLAPYPSVASITGCASAGDGSGYVLFGNIQDDVPATSQFLIIRTDAEGNELLRKLYATSTQNFTTQAYSGYYCNTSDIISSGDGNFYASAFNVKYNLPNISNEPIYTDDDNSARIFKIRAEAKSIDTIASVRLKFDVQNMVADLLLTENNGLLLGLNPLKISAGIYYSGKQNSFVAHLDQNLSIQSVSNIQTHYLDYLSSFCRMADGHYAIETMIQSFGEDNYRLEIIKTDENGNF